MRYILYIISIIIMLSACKKEEEAHQEFKWNGTRLIKESRVLLQDAYIDSIEKEYQYNNQGYVVRIITRSRRYSMTTNQTYESSYRNDFIRGADNRITLEIVGGVDSNSDYMTSSYSYDNDGSFRVGLNGSSYDFYTIYSSESGNIIKVENNPGSGLHDNVVMNYNSNGNVLSAKFTYRSNIAILRESIYTNMVHDNKKNPIRAIEGLINLYHDYGFLPEYYGSGNVTSMHITHIITKRNKNGTLYYLADTTYENRTQQITYRANEYPSTIKFYSDGKLYKTTNYVYEDR